MTLRESYSIPVISRSLFPETFASLKEGSKSFKRVVVLKSGLVKVDFKFLAYLLAPEATLQKMRAGPFSRILEIESRADFEGVALLV